MTRAQGLEWLELAFKKGYRDEYDQQPRMRKKPLAQLIVGPVYGSEDAILLRNVYSFGRSVGLAQREADLAEENK
jgi:hypothetical protein